MRINLQQLRHKLLKLKCEYGKLIYNNFKNEQYSLKGCENNLEDLKEQIELLNNKIKLLSYNFKSVDKNGIITPFKLNNNHLNVFFEKEDFLTSCDKKILEMI